MSPLLTPLLGLVGPGRAAPLRHTHEVAYEVGAPETIPDATTVRAQLAHILASDLFAGSARLSRLLRYVVERTLDGRGDEIKEYVLGTEVFDRGADYDPRLDSIVRVEARRLRGKLDEYYARPEARRDVVIRLHRGSYVPTFEVPAPESASLSPVAPGRLPWRSRRGAVLVAAALSLAVITLLALQLVRSAAPLQAGALPRIAVLPFASYPADADTAALAARVTDGLTAELVRAGGLEVVSRTSASQFGSLPRAARDAGAALNAAWLVEATLHREVDGIRLDIRVVDAGRDRKIWAEDVSAPLAGVRDLERRAAAAVATAVRAAASR